MVNHENLLVEYELNLIRITPNEIVSMGTITDVDQTIYKVS